MFSLRRVRQLLARSILDTIANREGKPQQRLEARQLKDTIRGGYTRVRQPYVRKAPMRRIRRQRNERPRTSRSFS